MVDSSRVIHEAEAMLRRLSPEARRLAHRARQRRWRALLRRLKLIFYSVLAIMLAAGTFGLLVAPLGVEGLMLAFIAMALTAATILAWPGTPSPTPETLAKSDLALLPQRTEEWLERQRPALPAPAARLVDGIGLRLEALAPQLQTLDPREPAAIEIRKLIGEELPELIDGYRRVPEALRRESRNGMVPDRHLIEGLTVVESELGRMSEQLASGDLHKLATQGRYLELKYKGDESE
ncbi:hypothetical protein CLG96_14925 [Sphingomonas oleivorans]|uniref:Uncharacterized protein n=1 Tax=Sphingomonas oleivorans TaxID=1735121 RepID=A0A2T5FUT0_9SPHN|nr:hypothetical protein [Sphingomonas oleivorans]PTQ08498.1 hypothetical protein CLG96_14925 [Sphingomonas oleivorans]